MHVILVDEMVLIEQFYIHLAWLGKRIVRYVLSPRRASLSYS